MKCYIHGIEFEFKSIDESIEFINKYFEGDSIKNKYSDLYETSVWSQNLTSTAIDVEPIITCQNTSNTSNTYVDCVTTGDILYSNN